MKRDEAYAVDCSIGRRGDPLIGERLRRRLEDHNQPMLILNLMDPRLRASPLAQWQVRQQLWLES